MSSLAFDKQGKPFGFQRRTKKLLVRLFRNPSARGTCSQVMNSDGQPLFVDPETDYNEFRRAVGHVPGLYRLDQCDENGIELEDAQAAYVAIDVARNASPSSGESGAADVNPLVVIEHLVAVQADAMKTMASQHASVMAATAEILRAPYRPPLPMPPTIVRNASPEDQDDDENDEPVVIESPWARVAERAMPMFEMVGGLAVAILQAKFLPNTTIALPRMPTVPAPPAPPRARPSSATRSPAASVVVDADADHATAVEEPDTEPSATAAPPHTEPPSSSSSVSSQYARLFAIRDQLTPDERASAEQMIASMALGTRAEWLAALSSLPFDQALTSVRAAIAQPRTPAP
ncbi:MAG: hypothetical protein AB7T06_10890 [Kofleriaceae bacterium]